MLAGKNLRTMQIRAVNRLIRDKKLSDHYDQSAMGAYDCPGYRRRLSCRSGTPI